MRSAERLRPLKSKTQRAERILLIEAESFDGKKGKGNYIRTRNTCPTVCQVDEQRDNH